MKHIIPLNDSPRGATTNPWFYQPSVFGQKTHGRSPTDQPAVLMLLFLILALVLDGCSINPVQAKRASPQTVQRQLKSNVLSTGELSNFTQLVLNRWDLAERFEKAPKEAQAELRQKVVDGQGGSDEIYALAELAYQYAQRSGDRAYYRAAAVYAYAFLFPGAAGEPPSPFDPRLRDGADLYNRSISAGFAADKSTEVDLRDGADLYSRTIPASGTVDNGDEVDLRGGSYSLPFGQLDVSFDPKSLRWADRKMVHFVPVTELEVSGLLNRYRQPGIGAPLAAGTEPLQQQQDTKLFVPRGVQVPVTALLRVDNPRRQLTGNRVQATLELYPATEFNQVAIEGQQVPLEADPSAVIAYQLSRANIWEWELRGFLLGDFVNKAPAQLFALEPYRPGRFPVVFVHGTASSPARWADMFNELRNDPRIQEHFQFWFFSYSTGNPIPWSALQLRDTLEKTVQKLDPEGKDPALHQMVIIGHSQGGLLTKMTAIDTGDRLWNSVSTKPLDKLWLSDENRELLRQGYFLKPEPFVGRVVFIATPQHGSYVAGNRIAHWVASLVKLPIQLLKTTTDIVARNPNAFPSAQSSIGSVFGMTPGNPFIKGLASIPVAPGIPAHSIIAVQGDGSPQEGNDGVVEYSSAHIEEAQSEKVVRSGHSTQSNPHTIAEVHRILLLHLDQACNRPGGCPKPPPDAGTAP
ncbi:MAG: alpha/beta fold hydrolase [Candidatus Competibacteraceae bacterium]